MILFSVSAARAAVYPVTNTDDSGADSLRQAIIKANNSPESDTIVFNLPGCPCTITLTSGELSIANTGTLTIIGPAAEQFSISGNNTSRVFYIQPGAEVEIKNLTITGGNGIGAVTNLLGGGIFNHGTLALSNSTISGNSAGIGGGGIYTNRGTLTMTNSTVSGNSSNNANSRGGGLDNYGSTMTLINSTVSGNSANTGGGIYNNNLSRVMLKNTIVANSISGGDCFNVYDERYPSVTDAEYSLIEDGLGCVNGTNINNLTGDPMLGHLQDNGGPTQTHALLAGSIAIDAGNSTLTTDQRGFTRPVDLPLPNALGGNGSDIGAFEVQAPNVSAQQRINDLIALVQSYNLNKGIETALLAKLNAALTYIAEGNTQAARDSLQAFINQVNAQTGKKITAEQAEALTQAANQILRALQS